MSYLLAGKSFSQRNQLCTCKPLLIIYLANEHCITVNVTQADVLPFCGIICATLKNKLRRSSLK